MNFPFESTDMLHAYSFQHELLRRIPFVPPTGLIPISLFSLSFQSLP